LQFSAAAYTVTEPTTVSATATITVARAGASLGVATVAFSTANGTATAGSDYVATAKTLVFGQGETSKTVGVPILPDGLAEGNETVLLTLANPGGGATLGATATAVLTIIDSVPSARFSASTYSVTEGTAATITVLRGGTTTGTLRVNYASGGGTALVRAIDISGTTPDPPATSSTRSTCSGRQTNQPPIGPRSSSWSPRRSSSTRYGDTSPSDTSCTVNVTRDPSGAEAREYERRAE